MKRLRTSRDHLKNRELMNELKLINDTEPEEAVHVEGPQFVLTQTLKRQDKREKLPTLKLLRSLVLEPGGKVTPFVWGLVIFTVYGLISVCLRK